MEAAEVVNLLPKEPMGCKAVHMEDPELLRTLQPVNTWDEHEGVGFYVNWQNTAGREVSILQVET